MYTKSGLSDRIQVGALGHKVREEFPSQECSFTLILSNWESLEDSGKASERCLWSCCVLLSQYYWTLVFVLQHTPNPSRDQDFTGQLRGCFICWLAYHGQENQLWYELQTNSLKICEPV